MIKLNISKRIISLVVAVLLALPFSMFSVFADGIGDGRGNVYAGIIDVPSYAHDVVHNLMDGSMISQAKNGSGILKYYRKLDNSLVPLYCIEPGVNLHTGDKLDLNEYIRNKTNQTLTEKEDVAKMLGRLFLFAYTGEASDLAEPMAQYYASQLLVWEIVVGERDMFFNHIKNSNGGNVCDVLNSMNSGVANRVRGYYDSYVSQMKNHLKMPSFSSLREGSAQVVTVDSSGKVVITDTNNVLSNFTFSSSTGSVTVNGNELTVTVSAGQTATITASKTVNTQKRAMFCYGASGVQTVVSVGSLEADPRNVFVKVKGLEKGTLEIIKTSEDGVVSNISFTVTGGGKTYNVKTDMNGNISIPDLTPGTYTVTETVPVRYQTQQSKTVTVQAGKTASVSFANVLKKGSIKINKQAEDGEIGGRAFTISGNGKTYTVSTNSDGIANLADIPVYDSDNKKITYTISEKNVPVKYIIPTEQTATLTADATTTKTFKNVLKKSLVKIVKKDAETDEIIAVSGIGFKVWDKVNKIYISQNVSEPTQAVIDTFYTDESGSLMLPQELIYGEYELHEVQTAQGYWLGNEKVSFKVDGTEQVITVEKYNKAQKGRISIYKTGDVFKSVAVSSSVSLEQNGNEVENMATYSPVFVESPLSDAVFEVIASEDIITADGTIHAKSGNVVTEVTTDKNGYAVTGLLYLGKYEVREKTAPYGYVQNEKSQFVELSYAGQEIEVRNTVNTSFFNDYQGIEISLEKMMEQVENFGIGANNEYLNVRFGLFADEEITAKDGTTIPKNGLIAEISLGENMTAKFETPIPFGKYYVQEISTDKHYVLNGEKYLVNFEYMGQNINTISVDCGKFVNVLKRGNVNGFKIDEETESPLANAVFGLFKTTTTEYSANNAILTATSDENGCFSFTNIPYGKYIVHEIKAPEGYILSDESYPVTVSENEEIVELSITNEKKPEVPNVPDSPKTGVDIPLSKLFTVAVIALISSIALWKKTKRREDSYEN